MILTKRQADVLAFIKQYHATHQCPPTMREIMTQFGMRSTNGIECHLKALESKGAITRKAKTNRSITPTGDTAADLLREAKKKLLARDFTPAVIEFCGRIDLLLGEAS